MRLLRLAPLALVAVLTLQACGGDETSSADGRAPLEGSGPLPSYTLQQAERALELTTGLALVRTGGGAGVAGDVRPQPVDTVRYEEQGGREFDLLVFATRRQARAARSSVRATEIVREGGAYSQAANLIAVTPESPGLPVYDRVFDAMRLLATQDRDGVPPARAGGAGGPESGSLADQALDIGQTLELGGVTYDVSLARQLNPAIEPDGALLEDRPARGDRLLFGVFLRACNEGDAPRRTSAGARLLTTFGQAVAQSPGAVDRFAYRSRTLQPGACSPAEGSPAEATVDGALVLFEIPRELLQDRPLLLELRAGDRRGLMTLDV